MKLTQKTKIGTICIVEKQETITHLIFSKDAEFQDDEGISCLLIEAFRQLNAYLDGKLKDFSLPLAFSGSPFMCKVWATLQTIKYGDQLTYKELAKKIGHSRAYRAVGLANHKNPLPIFIPCHRVICSNGSYGGYRGGIDLKIQLLKLEAGNV